MYAIFLSASIFSVPNGSKGAEGVGFLKCDAQVYCCMGGYIGGGNYWYIGVSENNSTASEIRSALLFEMQTV